MNIYRNGTFEYQFSETINDTGKYDTSNLYFVKEGLKTYQYDPTSDTLTVRITFSRINPIYGSWNMISTDGNLNINLNTDNTFTFTSTLYGNNRSTYGIYDPSNGMICLSDIDGPCGLYSSSSWHCSFKMDQGNLNQAIFTQYGNSFTLQRT